MIQYDLKQDIDVHNIKEPDLVFVLCVCVSLSDMRGKMIVCHSMLCYLSQGEVIIITFNRFISHFYQ